MRERRLLRRRGIAQERPGGTGREIAVIDAERREIECAEMLRKRTVRRCCVELPCRQRARRYAIAAHRRRRAVRDEQFGYVQPLQCGRHLARRHFGQRELSRCQIEPGETRAMLARIERDEQAVALRVEQIGIGHGARRDDAQHFALDGTLARRGIADLLADRDRFAEPHQLREITVDRMVRDAGHRNRRACRLPPRGQRDVEEARGTLRVVVEQLVEIAHSVEQELVRMRRLCAKVLLHHRRMLRNVSHQEIDGK